MQFVISVYQTIIQDLARFSFCFVDQVEFVEFIVLWDAPVFATVIEPMKVSVAQCRQPLSFSRRWAAVPWERAWATLNVDPVTLLWLSSSACSRPLVATSPRPSVSPPTFGAFFPQRLPAVRL